MTHIPDVMPAACYILSRVLDMFAVDFLVDLAEGRGGIDIFGLASSHDVCSWTISRGRGWDERTCCAPLARLYIRQSRGARLLSRSPTGALPVSARKSSEAARPRSITC